MATQTITVDVADYSIIISEDFVDGGYYAECPAIPGCWVKGNTIAVCMQNLTDKIREINQVKKLHNDNYHKMQK